MRGNVITQGLVGEAFLIPAVFSSSAVYVELWQRELAAPGHILLHANSQSAPKNNNNN